MITLPARPRVSGRCREFRGTIAEIRVGAESRGEMSETSGKCREMPGISGKCREMPGGLLLHDRVFREIPPYSLQSRAGGGFLLKFLIQSS